MRLPVALAIAVLASSVAAWSPISASSLEMASQKSGEIKVVAKKTAKPIPSPQPKWPPKGFKGKDGVFAKVPTSKELIGLLSAKRTLQSVVKNCEEYACGAVIAAAETGCVWWEVNSSVFRLVPENLTRERIGTLVTVTSGSDKREQKTIFLISGAEVTPGVSISGIKVTCHRDGTNKPKNGNTYKALVVETPSPTPESD